MEGSQPPGGPPQGQPNPGGAPYGHHPPTSYPSQYPPQQHPGASGGHMSGPPGGYPGYAGHGAPPPGHGGPPGGYHPQMHPGQHPGYPGYPRHAAPPGHMMHPQRPPVAAPQAAPAQPPAPQQPAAPVTTEAETYDNPYTPQPSTPGTADNTASEAPSTPQTATTDPAAQSQPAQATPTQPAPTQAPGVTTPAQQGAPQPGFPPHGQPGPYPPHYQGGPHMQRPPMPRQYTTSPRYTAENLTAMQKALAEMQHQNLTNDPRYHQLVNAIRDAELQLRRQTHSTFTPTQLSQLRAQIMAYKQLSRTQNIDPQLLLQVKGQQGQRGPAGAAQPPQPAQEAAATAQPPTPSKPEDGGSEGDKSSVAAATPNAPDSRPSTAGPEKEEGSDKENAEKKEPKQEPTDEAKSNEPDTPRAFSEGPPVQRNSDLYELLRDKRPGYGANKLCPVQKPKGIDPAVILEENEKRINARVLNRITELEGLPANLPSELRIRAQIELRSLRLLGFQRQLRQEVISVTKQDTTLETALNTNAYRRKKKQGLKDARITEKIEKQHKTEAERRKKRLHQDFLLQVMNHQKEFYEYHKNNRSKVIRTNKALIAYYSNSEARLKREQERREKERMRLLKQEDEEGYRKLIDRQKDKRLAHLLDQTDAYIKELTSMLKGHKEETAKKKKVAAGSFEDPDDPRVPMVNTMNGMVLKGENAPKRSQLVAFMQAHPGWKPVEEPPKEEKKEGEGEAEESKEEKEAKENKDPVDVEDEDQKDDKSYYMTAHGVQEKIEKQPSILVGGTLKPYQMKGLEWLVSLFNNNLNGILADEMGLGKTIQTIAMITHLVEFKGEMGPYLVIVPLSTLSNWVLEFQKWAPSISVIGYKGSPNTRRLLANAIRGSRFNVLITTYEYIIKDKPVLSKVKWKFQIVDEGHRMKNQSCKLTQVLNTHYLSPHRLLLTGTPLQNKLPELWALMNFLLPSIFKSVATFEQWFNAPFQNAGEKVELNEEESILIIRRLHKVLRPFLLRRLKKEVETQLPDKVEHIIRCEMSALQTQLYKHMKQGYMLMDTNDKKNKSGNKALMNTIMQLRKICNHPFMFRHVEEAIAEKMYGPGSTTCEGSLLVRSAGKFELMERILPKLKATGHKVLIFTQMTQVILLMEDYFNQYGYKYLRLDGSTKADDRGELLKMFNAPDSDYDVFVLSTRAGGLGLNLQTADTVIIFDSDWNPHQDMQAQDRAHRIGQQNEVRVLRFVTSQSVEERILAAARYKLTVDEKVIQAGKFDNKSSGSERRQMLMDIIAQEGMDEEEDEIPDDETINMMLQRSQEEFELFQKMDSERIMNQKPGQARLMEEDELPDFLTKTVEEAKEEMEDSDRSKMYGKGSRSRREVNYGEGLTEEQWLSAVDNGDDVNALEEAAKKSGGSGKRKREESPEQESSSKDSRKKKKSQPAQPLDEETIKKMKALVDYIVEYEDSEGRRLSDPFIHLPPKRDLPDYYEQIKRPVDVSKIRNRIRAEKYRSLEDLEKDINTMCKNAQQYNIEGSLIFDDSVILQSVFTSAKQMLESTGKLPTSLKRKPEEPLDIDEDSKKSKKSKKKKRKKQESSEEEMTDSDEYSD